jgi:hypothetical protein
MAGIVTDQADDFHPEVDALCEALPRVPLTGPSGAQDVTPIVIVTEPFITVRCEACGGWFGQLRQRRSGAAFRQVLGHVRDQPQRNKATSASR